MNEKIKNFEYYYWSNSFEYSYREIDDCREDDIVLILNEIVNDISVEYYNFLMFCRYFNINVKGDFTYYFMNQSIIRNEIRKHFKIGC